MSIKPLKGFPSVQLFRFLVFLIGIALFVFHIILLAGAIVNLPASWVGVLYSSFGVVASTACFLYFFKQKKMLFIIIIPAALLMALTLVGIDN